MPVFIAMKRTTEEDGTVGYEYVEIGDELDNPEQAMIDFNLKIGDKIFRCEEIAVVEGKLKYIKNKV